MKKIRNLLIILIIINVAVLAYLVIIPKVEVYDVTQYAIKQDDIKRQKGELDESNNTKPVRDSIISFKNEIILLSNYKGELATGNVNVKFTDLLESGFANFYKETKGMSSTGIANYFETNKEDIAMQTGITDVSDFERFIQKLQIYQDTNIKCDVIEIVENSYVNGNEYDDFKVQLTYNNGQAIVLNVSIRNRLYANTPTIIIK